MMGDNDSFIHSFIE